MEHEWHVPVVVKIHIGFTDTLSEECVMKHKLYQDNYCNREVT